jgi:hemerythrin-like domain-containing protein
VRATGEPPRFELLKAMLSYIREFPEKLHHPKEEDFLFKRLRERTQEFDDLLDDLQRQHRECARLVDELDKSIARYEADPESGHEQFVAAVRRFAAAQQRHMSFEAGVIIPAAREYLTAADWDEIYRAFAENGDPRFSAEAEEEFRQLFARIQNLTPPAPAREAALALS